MIFYKIIIIDNYNEVKTLNTGEYDLFCQNMINNSVHFDSVEYFSKCQNLRRNFVPGAWDIVGGVQKRVEMLEYGEPGEYVELQVEQIKFLGLEILYNSVCPYVTKSVCMFVNIMGYFK